MESFVENIDPWLVLLVFLSSKQIVRAYNKSNMLRSQQMDKDIEPIIYQSDDVVSKLMSG